MKKLALALSLALLGTSPALAQNSSPIVVQPIVTTQDASGHAAVCVDFFNARNFGVNYVKFTLAFYDYNQYNLGVLNVEYRNYVAPGMSVIDNTGVGGNCWPSPFANGTFKNVSIQPSSVNFVAPVTYSAPVYIPYGGVVYPGGNTFVLKLNINGWGGGYTNYPQRWHGR